MSDVTVEFQALRSSVRIPADEIRTDGGFLKVYRNNALVALFDIKTIKGA